MSPVTPTVPTLTVLYDGECGLCRQLKAKLKEEPLWIELEFLPLQHELVPMRFPGIEAYQPEKHLVVIDDQRNVYTAEGAWIMILYATRAYRDISLTLSDPALRPLARGICSWISSHRKRISNARLYQTITTKVTP